MTGTVMSESIAELMPALIAAKKEFAPALKGALNPAFKSKYVDLGGVLDAIEDALLKHGIVIAQPTRIAEDGSTVLVTRLVHESGEWIGGEYPVRMVQQTPQSEGSGLTYARRYSLMALAGIAPEDDDGNAASARPAADPRADLFSEIKRIGHGKRMSDREIADDFAGWSEGTPIVDAPIGELRKYRDHLNGNRAAS